MKTRIYPLLILLAVTALSSASASASAATSTPRRQHEARHGQPVPAAAVPQQAGRPTDDTLLTGIPSPDISAATSPANTSQTGTLRTDTLPTDTPQAPPADSATLTGGFTGHRPAAIDTPVADSLLAGAPGTLLSGQLPDTLALAQAAPGDSAGTAADRKRFLPTRKRIDREINRIRFIFKREVAIGLTVSYGTITSDDTDYMLILDDLNFNGSIFTINPSFSYFVKDNLSFGARFGYSKTDGHIDNAALDLGEANDMNISFSDINLNSTSSSFGIFMRSYAGIDAKGHFGLFAELEASYKTGKSVFSYKSNEEIKYTHSNNQQFKFSFNPGCAVFIFPNVCTTLSFGLGGVQYTKVTQTDSEGKVIGTREASKMLFRLNLANIRIGLNILL